MARLVRLERHPLTPIRRLMSQMATCHVHHVITGEAMATNHRTVQLKEALQAPVAVEMEAAPEEPGAVGAILILLEVPEQRPRG